MRARRPHPAGGFTLVELLVVMAIIALLLRLAIPLFQDAALSNKLTSYANSFFGSAQLARGEAIKRNAVVRICRSATGTACATTGTWQQGWIVFVDNGAGTNANNATVDSDELVLQRQTALTSDYSFTSTSYNLAFQPGVVGTDQQDLVLCREAGKGNRTVSIRAGRATVSKGTATSCP
jgi:type IV fimbrial biogenesis protein FimT